MSERLISAVGLSLLVTLALIASSGGTSRLGVPQQWPWLLTGIQVLSLWAAGRRHWWGWLLGAGVQPAWIAYALLTGQLGFIPGCAISAAVQIYSFIRTHRASGKREKPRRRLRLRGFPERPTKWALSRSRDPAVSDLRVRPANANIHDESRLVTA